jgi:hypothetical protein
LVAATALVVAGMGSLTGCRVLIIVAERDDWFAEEFEAGFAGELSLARAVERDEHDGADLSGDWRPERVIVLEGRDDELLVTEKGRMGDRDLSGLLTRERRSTV